MEPEQDAGRKNDTWVDACEAAAHRRLVSEFPSICLVVCHPDGTPVAEWVGEQVAGISGYTAAELEADPNLWMSIVHPADQGKLRSACSCLAEGRHAREEYRIYRKDGQMRWIGDTGAAASVGPDGLVRSIRCITDITAARSVAQWEIDFKELVEETPVGITVRDTTGRLLYCNQAAARIYGWVSRDDLLGTRVEDVSHPDFAKRFREEIFPELLSGPWSSEAPIQRQDGTVVYVSAGANQFRDSEGRVVAVYSILTDITDLKETEAALRESEEKHRSLVENLDAVVFRIDRDMHPIALSGHVEKLTGYTAEEVIKHPALLGESIHPDDMGKTWERLQMAEALRVPQAVELRIRHRTGVTKWIRGTLTPIFDEGGRLLWFDGVLLDITDRRAAEEAARESQERYKSLVNSLDAVIFRTDTRNAPIALYGRVAEQTGYTVTEFMQDALLWTNIVHPDDREHMRESFGKLAATGERGAIEMRIVRKSGAVRWVRAHVMPRYDDRGDLLYFDGVGIDITESVEAKQREAGRTTRMADLTELSQALASSLDTQQILDTATRRLCETLEAISVGITLEPSTGRISNLSICCPRGCEIEMMDRAIRRPKVTVDELFGEGGVTLRLAPDIRQVSEVAARLADAVKAAGLAELGPAMLAPVTAGANALGALFSTRPQGVEFDQEDLWFATEVASHASSALANATLYSQQARIAENLQRSLITAEPSLKCLDIATLYAPAPGEAQVGGDFFDVFNFGCDKVVMVIGDVSGKGLDAAIHTAEAKYMLRAFAHQNPDPVHAVSRLNDALYHYLPDETFVTLVYLLINACGHSLTYVNAGHEPCLVRCRDGGVFREIKPGGPLLGVTQSASYVAGEARLEPDDTLFCYTDGIVEVRRNKEQFGYQRLCEALSDAPPGDSRAIMEYVMGRVRGFGASRQTDDQVVLVVRPLA